jgi:hypothetical protein
MLASRVAGLASETSSALLSAAYKYILSRKLPSRRLSPLAIPMAYIHTNLNPGPAVIAAMTRGVELSNAAVSAAKHGDHVAAEALHRAASGRARRLCLRSGLSMRTGDGRSAQPLGFSALAARDLCSVYNLQFLAYVLRVFLFRRTTRTWRRVDDYSESTTSSLYRAFCRTDLFVYACVQTWRSEAEVLDGQREAELLEGRHKGDEPANSVRTSSRRA